jgi:hypothetical protein
MTPEAERQLRRIAERLGSLQTHPGFTLLVEEINKKRARMKETLTSRLMGGEDVAQMQRQADYDRGFIDGAMYSKTVVDAAARKMKDWDEGQAVTEPEEATDGWAGYGN